MGINAAARALKDAIWPGVADETDDWAEFEVVPGSESVSAEVAAVGALWTSAGLPGRGMINGVSGSFGCSF